MRVFLLQHTHTSEDEGDEGEDVKVIGIYSSEQRARDAIARMSTLPGFSGAGGDFHISGYDVDVDHWQEGFVTTS